MTSYTYTANKYIRGRSVHRERQTLKSQENSRSGNMRGATRVQTYRAAVAHSVQIRTQVEVQPTSISSDLSGEELVHPVRSMAEYMLASANIRWKKV